MHHHLNQTITRLCTSYFSLGTKMYCSTPITLCMHMHWHTQTHTHTHTHTRCLSAVLVVTPGELCNMMCFLCGRDLYQPSDSCSAAHQHNPLQPSPCSSCPLSLMALLSLLLLLLLCSAPILFSHFSTSPHPLENVRLRHLMNPSSSVQSDAFATLSYES